MKTSSTVVVCLALTLAGAHAQNAVTPGGTSQSTGIASQMPAPTAYQVVVREANSKTWQWNTYEPGPNGQTVAHLHQYKELATGMCYKNSSGDYVDSQELIQSAANGGVAQAGQYSVIFNNNLNSAGAISQLTPDGKTLNSSILGLAYYDTASGQSVMIAQIQDSQGELISANQALYPNAFSGINASVRYTYKRGVFEQDVILNAQPVDPAALGLNPETTEIEVLTEFIDPPEPDITEDPVPDNALPDEDISWGVMRIGHGRAFDLGQPSNVPSKIRVRRQWLTVGARKILVEGVLLSKIQPFLNNLPLQSSVKSKLPVLASKKLVLPQRPLAQTKAIPMKLASAKPSNKGYVIDYKELNTDKGGYTFQGDETYLVDGAVNLTGTTTIEGGAVIKVDGMSGFINIDTSGTVNCETAQFRPGVFTSINDSTIGESMAGSGDPNYTGTPGVVDVSAAIEFNAASAVVHDLRFSYCQYAIVNENVSWLDIWNCQFMNVATAVFGYSVGMHNVLMSTPLNISTCFVDLEGPSFVGENITAQTGYALLEPDYYPAGTPTIALTNCLIANSYWLIYPYTYTLLTASTVWVPAPSIPIFQTVGGGSHYLTNGSPYRNAGTTNISPALLTELSQKTTYPPIVYSNITISATTTFSPQAQRDNIGNPDLGYHYDPLDYAFGGVNDYSNLTFTAGTVMGWFEPPGYSGAGYGISIFDLVVVALNGTASQPCFVARYDTVQEGGDGLWKDKGYLAAITGQSLSGGYSMSAANAAQVWPNFTHHAALAGDPNHYREENALIKVVAQNSEFWSANIGAYWVYLNFTNCLFDRAAFVLLGSNPAICGMRNCTMHGGSVTLDEYGQTWPVWIEECAFDGTLLAVDDNSSGNTNLTYCDFNAFVTNDDRLPMLGTHDVIVTNFNWQSSWFGNFYLPTNNTPTLINVGSTTADKFGLYHFTTQTNQIPETNSIVDIGYHYVATDAYGNPLDSNGDGIPDYIEDANGNGLVDSGEIGWNIVGDLGLKVIITQPRNGSSSP